MSPSRLEGVVASASAVGSIGASPSAPRPPPPPWPTREGRRRRQDPDAKAATSATSHNSLASVASMAATLLLLLASCSPTAASIASGMMEKILTIKTCGKPNIQNIMTNVTASPGQSATFKCQVDMSCIVAYIEWYHEMDNGTEKLIKTASSSGDPHVHVIRDVKATDSGMYTCIAGNVLGQATASAFLEVNAAPPSAVWRATSPAALLTTLLALAVVARQGRNVVVVA